MALKKVTANFAKNEFITVGLILIIYALFVLYIPSILDVLFNSLDFNVYIGPINIALAIKATLLIVGTVLPFSLLYIYSKKYKKAKTKVSIPFRNIFMHSLVFFTVTSFAIFVTTAFNNLFTKNTILVSGIGITIDAESMNDIIYVLIFIVISPLLEEFAFRGALLNLLSKYGKYFALIASSTIFALAHGSITEFIPSFFMGIILGKITLNYKTLTPACLIHIIFNFIIYILLTLPENFSFFRIVLLLLIYLITGLLNYRKIYKKIKINKAVSFNKVLVLFFKTSTIIVACSLFILHSFLSFFI